MAAVEIGWTPTMLNGVVMALDTSLGRIPEDSVRDTGIEENWQKARDWVNTVKKMTSRPLDDVALQYIPEFPLSSGELQALQASVDRIAQARATASATKAPPTTKRARKSIQRVTSSAFLLGLFLIAWTGITLADLIVFHGINTDLLALSVTCSAIALMTWMLLFTHIGMHRSIIKQIHPLS